MVLGKLLSVLTIHGKLEQIYFIKVNPLLHPYDNL